MGKAFTDFASQVGQQAAGGVLGLALGGIENKRQFKQAKKMTRLQLDAQKELTNFNFGKQMEMWELTNYGAQMEQLKKAGLNPALLYGMSGGGGATTNVDTGNVSGHGATRGTEAITMANTAGQLGLMRAQKDLLEAQTEKTKAEAAKTAGVDTQLAGTQIESLTQGIQNQKAQETLTKLENELKSLHLKLKQSTFHDEEQQVHFQMEKTYKELEILRNDKLLSDEQFKDKVALLRNQAIGQFLDNQLTKAQTDHERQVIENAKLAWMKIYEEIKSEMWQRYISGETLNVQRRLADYKFKEEVNKEMEDEISNLLSSIIGGIIGGRLGGKNPPTPIKGFHQR